MQRTGKRDGEATRSTQERTYPSRTKQTDSANENGTSTQDRHTEDKVQTL